MTVNVQKRRRYKVRRVYHRPEVRHESSPGRQIYMILMLLTAAGVFIGAYTCGAYGDGGIAALLETHGQADFFTVFTDSLVLISVYVALCFFGGFSSAGAPAAYLLCIFKGMGAGFLSACIFADGLTGINSRAAADILPFEAMSIAVIIFAARENIRLSRIIADRTFGSTENRGGVNIRLYLIKFAVISAAAVITAAADGLISMLSSWG